jgi:pimeloyl-ACP methyl ester carboxylesterase
MAYFAHADLLPIEPPTGAYSPVNAWWLAEASLLVYGDAPFITRAIDESPLPGLGFSSDWLGTPEANRGLVLCGETDVVVVFRGTRINVHQVVDAAELAVIDQDDLWTDCQFVPAACRAGGWVHRGFGEAYAEVNERVDAVVRALQPGQRLWLAGHSLGGALATLAAAHVGPGTVSGLYTYGCPRVGNAAFVATLPQHDHWRIVHRDDSITTVPPAWLGYVHGGTLQRIGSGRPRATWNDLVGGLGSLGPLVRDLASQLKVELGEMPMPVAGLVEHAATYYATLLWNALVEARRAT